jgi:hypothetical protein
LDFKASILSSRLMIFLLLDLPALTVVNHKPGERENPLSRTAESVAAATF